VHLFAWLGVLADRKRKEMSKTGNLDIIRMSEKCGATANRYLQEAMFRRWEHRLVEKGADVSLNELKEQMRMQKMRQSEKLNSLLLMKQDGSAKALCEECFV
jgi:hypothetical protein